jgi:hypothetical protein
MLVVGEIFSHSDDDDDEDVVFWDVRYILLLKHQHCKRMFGLCHQGYMEATGSSM